jgi:hypothetical protein
MDKYSIQLNIYPLVLKMVGRRKDLSLVETSALNT